MLNKFTLAATYLLSTSSCVFAKDYAPKDLNTGFDAKASGVAQLLAKAEAVSGNQNRALEGEYYNQNQYSHISSYSIQFQGCHHIQQWNEDADDEDVRLQTKRLARFRLVPFQKCDVVSPWASAKAIRDAASVFGRVDYGEYIVDLNTFVSSYLQAKKDENDNLCADYEATCQAKCGGDDDNDNYYDDCMEECYQGYGCTIYSDDDNSIDMYDYAECAQLNWETDDDDVEYYFGPSCADQGGEIRMNLFTDDTCTTLAQCGNNGQTRGASCYTRTTGDILPGSKSSIIEDPCIPCSENYIYLEEAVLDVEDEDATFDYDNFDFGDPRDVCSGLYDLSGKCEKHMKNGEYNYACKYLEGIQIGVSREGYAVAVRRSITADAFMGVMVITSSFIGMYIYYLKNLN